MPKTKKTYRKKTKKMRMSKALTMMKPEVKHYDFTDVITISSNTGTFLTNNSGPWPVQGSDFVNRQGRIIRVIALDFRCSVNVAAPAQVNLNGDNVRVDVWIDHETKGALAVNTDIYDNVALGNTTILSPRNLNNVKRFKKICTHSHVIQVNAVNATPAATAVTVDHMMYSRIPNMNMLVHYSSVGTATVADIIDNSIVVAATNSQLSPASSWGTVKYISRFYFVDQ